MPDILIDAFAAISVYTFVTTLHDFCMIWQVTSLTNLIKFIVFNASPRDENEFHIKLQCKLWPFWTSDQHQNYHWGHRGSLSYGGWIYSYLCNQCQFTSNVVSSNSGQVMCNRYIIMLWSLSVNWGRGSFFSRYFGFPPQ